MHGWIGFAAGIAAALVVVPAALSSLPREPNFRGASVPTPAGIAVLASAFVALGVLGSLDVARWQPFEDGYPFAALVWQWAPFLLGVAVLGLVDDTLGRRGEAGSPRGWRGHLAELREGRLSTGALKAVGIASLALWAGSPLGALQLESAGELVISAFLLATTTNLFNLLDTKPGRAGKAFVLLGGVVLIAAPDAQAEVAGRYLAPFLGAALVVLAYDLRERAMLGDTGSNLLGAMAGVILVLCLGTAAQAVALAVVLALTVLGEFRSLGQMIERIPLVRHLDSLGRKA